MGGAIFSMQGELVIDASTLRLNSAVGGLGPGEAQDGLGLGGAIFNLNGTTSITGSTLTSNDAGSGYAGAIYNLVYDQATIRDASVTVDGSTLSSNNAGQGGTIWSERLLGAGAPSLAITDSSLTFNRANLGFGGAVTNATASRATITGSTFTGNESANGGGAVENMFSGADLSVTNSTFNGNSAAGYGGAIDTFAGGTTLLRSSTVTSNTANSDGDSFGDGGGTQFGAGGGEFRVRDTIIALNRSLPGGGSSPECSGAPYVSLGRNLIFRNTPGCSGFSAPTDFLGTDPLLGPLTDNGGPTRTRRPDPTSAAIDHASTVCPATDQRGIARPQGPRCDIGSVESR
jgi:hypothetical protein